MAHEGTSDGTSDSWLPVRVVIPLKLLVPVPLGVTVVEPLLETEADAKTEAETEALLEEAEGGVSAVASVSWNMKVP